MVRDPSPGPFPYSVCVCDGSPLRPLGSNRLLPRPLVLHLSGVNPVPLFRRASTVSPVCVICEGREGREVLSLVVLDKGRF